MRHRALLGAGLLAMLAVPALAEPGCPAIPPRNPMPREAMPEQLEIPGWRGRVAELDQQLSRINRASADLVLLGDSITQSWEPNMYAHFFGHRRVLNMGVWGDFTQGMLWRLQREWGDLAPRLVVLLIGTNNAPVSRPEDTALGIAEIIRFIHQRSPRSRVLLLGLLPRGADRNDPLRAVNARVNALIARCADNRGTFYIDPGSLLVPANGTLSELVSFDRLHLTMVGYAMLGAAIAPSISALMGE